MADSPQIGNQNIIATSRSNVESAIGPTNHFLILSKFSSNFLNSLPHTLQKYEDEGVGVLIPKANFVPLGYAGFSSPSGPL